MGDEYDALLLRVMEQFNGTPEEFGALLQTATMTIWHWSSTLREDKLNKANARYTICQLDGGRELVEMEKAFLERVR